MIDISLPLQQGLPTWPGSIGFQLAPIHRQDAGDVANVSRLDCDVHTGTHIDAPWHFVPNGATVEDLALTTLVGPALVLHLPDCDAIDAALLDSLALPAGTERLLFRTRNSDGWAADLATPAGQQAPFRANYVALTADAAQWIVAHGVRLVGVDYLSVQRYHDSPATHEILLQASVIILEGLNLAQASAGHYELVCLPLLLVGAEGAPARAILRPLPHAVAPAHPASQQ